MKNILILFFLILISYSSPYAQVGGASFDESSPSSSDSSSSQLEDSVVAKVNGKEITKNFVFYLSEVVRKTPVSAMTKSQFISSLKTAISNRLLYEEALRTAPELIESSERLTVLIEARDYWKLYLEKIAIPYADREVTFERVYAETAPEEDIVTLRQILVADMSTAENVLSQLKEGGISFVEAAMKYSKGFTAAKGGLVGSVKRSSTMYSPGVASVIFSLMKGEMSGVVNTELGPAIFLCEDRVPGDELRKKKAKDSMPQRVQTEAYRYAEKQAKSYADSKNIRVLATEESINRETPDMKQEALQYDGSIYTLGDIKNISGGISGDHGWKVLLGLAERAQRDLALRELYINAFKEDPLVAIRRRVLEEQSVAREVIQGRVGAINATEADIEEWINRNPERFKRPPSVDIALIYTKTEQRANQAKGDLTAGKDFAVVARTWSQADSAAKGGRVGPIPVATLPPEAQFLAKLPEGSVTSDPLNIKEGEGAGYYLFKVIRQLPEHQLSRQELDSNAIEWVRGRATADKRERAVLEFQKSLQDKANIEIVFDAAEVQEDGEAAVN